MIRQLLCVTALAAGFVIPTPPPAEAVQMIDVRLHPSHHHHRHTDHPRYRHIRLKSYYWS